MDNTREDTSLKSESDQHQWKERFLLSIEHGITDFKRNIQEVVKDIINLNNFIAEFYSTDKKKALEAINIKYNCAKRLADLELKLEYTLAVKKVLLRTPDYTSCSNKMDQLAEMLGVAMNSVQGTEFSRRRG